MKNYSIADEYDYVRTHISRNILLEMLNKNEFNEPFKNIALDMFNHDFLKLFLTNSLIEVSKSEFKNEDSIIIQKITLKFDKEQTLEIYSDRKYILNNENYFNIAISNLSLNDILENDFNKFQKMLITDFKKFQKSSSANVF